MAVQRAGIDPRTWVTAARVDDDPEASTWDPTLGWIVDVSPYGSDLEGDSELPCRIAVMGPGGAGFGEYLPPTRGCELVVGVVDGDPGSNPVILGYLSNEDDCQVPTEVNQLPIDGDALESSAAVVSPFDTEIRRSAHNRREEFEGDRHVQAANQILEVAGQLKLALRDASQSYVRGERFVEILTAWIDAVSSFVSANATADLKVYAAVNVLAPGSVLPNEITDVSQAAVEVPTRQAAFKSGAVAGDALSARIKGD